jgi:hypothetical protein
MAQAKIVVDTTYFPLVLHTMCAGYGRDDLEHMFRTYDSLMNGERRYAIVIHFPLDVAMMQAAERKLVADWWLPRRETIGRMNVMFAMVLESSILRGALTALLWMVQPPNPCRVAANTAEGVDICIDALRAVGEQPPLQILGLRAKLGPKGSLRPGHETLHDKA